MSSPKGGRREKLFRMILILIIPLPQIELIYPCGRLKNRINGKTCPNRPDLPPSPKTWDTNLNITFPSRTALSKVSSDSSRLTMFLAWSLSLARELTEVPPLITTLL